MNTTGGAIAGTPDLPPESPLFVHHTLPVLTADGSRFELLCVVPVGAWHRALHWLPALGISARHYLPFAEAVALSGTAVVVHEWRGIGSSNRRAGRRCNWGYRELLADDLPAGRAVLRARWPQATWLVGGHSLGGQIAMLEAALAPTAYVGVAVVASGAPYWRCFRRPWLILLAYTFAPCLAWLCGYLPGRRIRFGGNEARGVIVDWARSGRRGRYAARGLALDLEQALRALRTPVLGLLLADDWLGPPASLRYLLGKAPLAAHRVGTITAEDLGGVPATHFGWLSIPQPLAVRMAHWISALSLPNPVSMPPHDA